MRSIRCPGHNVPFMGLFLVSRIRWRMSRCTPGDVGSEQCYLPHKFDDFWVSLPFLPSPGTRTTNLFHCGMKMRATPLSLPSVACVGKRAQFVAHDPSNLVTQTVVIGRPTGPQRAVLIPSHQGFKAPSEGHEKAADAEIWPKRRNLMCKRSRQEQRLPIRDDKPAGAS